MATAKKSIKGKSTPKTAKPAKPAGKLPTTAKALKRAVGDHKEGSRKSKVHELFNKEGSESAWVLGLKLKLKEGTLRSWFAAWKRLQSEGKEPAKTTAAVTPATTSETIAA